jgi:hypothetical protein
LAYDRYGPGYPEQMYRRLADAAGLGPSSGVVEVGALCRL